MKQKPSLKMANQLTETTGQQKMNFRWFPLLSFFSLLGLIAFLSGAWFISSPTAFQFDPANFLVGALLSLLLFSTMLTWHSYRSGFNGFASLATAQPIAWQKEYEILQATIAMHQKNEAQLFFYEKVLTHVSEGVSAIDLRDVEKNKSPRLNCNAVDPV